jgi:predicted GNAT family acetyltransferase
MTIDLSQLEVRHNTGQRRFEIDLGNDIAIAAYRISGPDILFTHTEVPPAWQGQGIAGILAHAALEYARTEGLRVQPLCSYIAAWIARHPEYHAITAGYPAQTNTRSGADEREGPQG